MAKKESITGKPAVHRGDNRKSSKKALIAVLCTAVIAFAAYSVFTFLVFPAVPKDLTATPMPLFVVDHYVSGELTGLIDKHSFPKKARMEITPFLECGESHQYGDTFVLCGEDVSEEGARTVMYSKNAKLNEPFNLLCQAYEEEIDLKVRIVLISGGGRTKTVTQKVGEVYTFESITDSYARKMVPWKKMRTILWIISIVLILFTVFFGGLWQEWGAFSTTTLILGIISLLLLILPLTRISQIKKEREFLLHTLDNTKQIIEIRKSIPLSEAESNDEPVSTVGETDTISNVGADSTSVAKAGSSARPQSGKKRKWRDWLGL